MATRKAVQSRRKREVMGQLLSRQHRLLAKLKEEDTEERAPVVSQPADDADRAVESTSEELDLKILEMRTGKILQIEDALRKMADGTYGTCAWCGKRISAARLKLLPEATLCVNCQKELEREGQDGDMQPEWEKVLGEAAYTSSGTPFSGICTASKL